MKEYNVVTLENGKKYTEVYRLKDDKKTYVFLSDLDNPEDYCVRKLVKDDKQEYIVGLDDKEEFDRVFSLFSKEYLS